MDADLPDADLPLPAMRLPLTPHRSPPRSAILSFACLALALALALGSGCSRQPSASDGIANLEKSLGTAAGNPAIQVAIAAAKTNDLGMGVVALQQAKSAPGLTAEQLQTVEQTSQAIVQELLRRADAGDAHAKADRQLIERSRSQ